MSNRKISRRWLTRTLIIALLLAVVLIAVVPTAFAHGPQCWGAGCRGKSPQVQGCSHDAVTVAWTSNSHEVVQLRYSPGCHAYWSRTYSKLAPANVLYTRAALKYHVSATRVVNWYSTEAISKMWTGPATACGASVSKAYPGYVPVRCVN